MSTPRPVPEIVEEIVGLSSRYIPVRKIRCACDELIAAVRAECMAEALVHAEIDAQQAAVRAERQPETQTPEGHAVHAAVSDSLQPSVPNGEKSGHLLSLGASCDLDALEKWLEDYYPEFYHLDRVQGSDIHEWPEDLRVREFPSLVPPEAGQP